MCSTVLTTRAVLTRKKSSQSRLFIQGEVWIAGDSSAQNCRLHVTLYQTRTGANTYQEKVVANETYIELGTIDPWTCAHFSKDIYYVGEQLSDWSIIPDIGS